VATGGGDRLSTAGRALLSAIRNGGAFLEIETTPLRRLIGAGGIADPRRPAPGHTAQFQKRAASRSGNDTGSEMVAVVSASHRTKRLLRVLDSVPFHSHYSRARRHQDRRDRAGHADVYVNTERSKCKELGPLRTALDPDRIRGT